jgi:DNA end-binding protein Ku
MGARAMWKAELHAGGLRVAVKLYAAIEDRNIHFHLLHDQDMVRIEQRLANRETGKTVPYDEARRGFSIASDRMLVLEDDDLASLEPEASRTIAIEAFVPRSALNHQWYDRPYYLGPDGDEETYFAFAQALAKSDREGVARWVMRGKEYLGAVAEQDGYLVLITLRHEEEVIDVAGLTPPSGRELPPKERQMAEQLIRALKDGFDPSAFKDDYREQVTRLIAAKARGEEFEIEEYEAPEESESLSASLAASLKAMSR